MPIKACRWHLGLAMEARLVHVLSLWMKINWYLSFSLCGLRVHRHQIYFCSALLRCAMDQWGFASMTMTCRAAFMCYQMLYNRQVCIVFFANIVLILIKSNCNCVLCLTHVPHPTICTENEMQFLAEKLPGLFWTRHSFYCKCRGNVGRNPPVF